MTPGDQPTPDDPRSHKRARADEPARATARNRSLIARWSAKFADAGDGLLRGCRDESSLRVHFAAAIAALALGAFVGLEAWRWVVILLCITGVVTAEYFNSALERLVRAVSPQHHPEVAASLHLAAAAVLAASIGSVIVGLITLLPPTLDRLFP